MIRFSFISVFAWFLVACNGTPETIVSVHVEGAKPETPVKMMTGDSLYTGTLDSLGMVKFILAKDIKPGYAKIGYARKAIPVFIEPGKGFDLSLKTEGRRIMPVFTGEGASKNDYLNNERLYAGRPDFKENEDDFIKALAEQEKDLNRVLDSLSFDEPFKTMEKKRIHYMVYGVLPMYPDYHSYYAQDTAYKASAHYYEVLQSAITEETDPMSIPEYLSAQEGLIGVMAGKNMSGYDPLVYLKGQLEYVRQNIKNPELAEYFVDRFVTSYVDRSGVDHLAEIAPIYNEKVTTPAKKAAFDALCAKWSKIAKGQPSPGFKYLDIQGKEVDLSDLAGKYVYIDVWATWCGPCRGEIPHLQKLEHQYKSKNIHFVSISCDQDKAAWEKMVKEDKLGGIQLHNGKDQSFMDAFMIRGIPRFILLDKEGKIIAADMTRPSNPETVETLNQLEGI